MRFGLDTIGVPAGSRAAYTPSIGLRYVRFAAASYCEPSAIQTWSCLQCGNLPGVSGMRVTSDPSKDLQGFVAYASDRNEIVVSFRGTVATSIEDWLADLDAVKTSAYCSGCYVHKGFYNSWHDLKSGIVDSINTLSSQHPSASLSVTGHSLGAAIATNAAVDLLQSGYRVVRLVTFGCPRVGDAAFYRYASGLIPSNSRVVHHNDIVPHVPLESMGFHHLPTEVRPRRRRARSRARAPR